MRWSANRFVHRVWGERSWIVFAAIAMHGLWGLAMIVEPPVGRDATGGAAWNIYVRFVGVEFWRVWFLLSAVAATVALAYRGRAWAFWLLWPQQVALFAGFCGAFTNYFGVWDDFAMSRILRSSLWGVVAFLAHTGAMLDMARGER